MQDLTGQRFGRLVVVGLASGAKCQGHRYWACKCSCGNETHVTTSNLKRRVKSCGCLRRQPGPRKGYRKIAEEGAGDRRRILAAALAEARQEITDLRASLKVTMQRLTAAEVALDAERRAQRYAWAHAQTHGCVRRGLTVEEGIVEQPRTDVYELEMRAEK